MPEQPATGVVNRNVGNELTNWSSMLRNGIGVGGEDEGVQAIRSNNANRDQSGFTGHSEMLASITYRFLHKNDRSGSSPISLISLLRRA
ncbi:hypothetical protein PT974_00878 [Cladobotryum mycophilum]|uniref:Uncharacterized protein n=1 Tax=Cladobotryum mycophilum TaxID=491253 RepID=A0ABR0T2C1_9HYPO